MSEKAKWASIKSAKNGSSVQTEHGRYVFETFGGLVSWLRENMEGAERNRERRDNDRPRGFKYSPMGIVDGPDDDGYTTVYDSKGKGGDGE